MTLYPAAAWKPLAAHGGPMAGHLGLVLHVQQGNGSPFGWFSDPAAQASSTWWVSKTGAVEQYVDADLTAWAQAQGNATYNSVETEGYASDALTFEQLEAIAHLYAWGHVAYGWSFTLAEHPGDVGFGWHGMGGDAWGGHTGCPGALRAAQRAGILTRADQLTQGATDMTTPDQLRQIIRQELTYAIGDLEGAPNSLYRQQTANLPELAATVAQLAADLAAVKAKLGA